MVVRLTRPCMTRGSLKGAARGSLAVAAHDFTQGSPRHHPRPDSPSLPKPQQDPFPLLKLLLRWAISSITRKNVQTNMQSKAPLPKGRLFSASQANQQPGTRNQQPAVAE